MVQVILLDFNSVHVTPGIGFQLLQQSHVGLDLATDRLDSLQGATHLFLESFYRLTKLVKVSRLGRKFFEAKSGRIIVLGEVMMWLSWVLWRVIMNFLCALGGIHHTSILQSWGHGSRLGNIFVSLDFPTGTARQRLITGAKCCGWRWRAGPVNGYCV